MRTGIAFSDGLGCSATYLCTSTSSLPPRCRAYPRRRPAQEAKHVAKEIARLQDPNAGYTFMRACQLLDLRARPDRARLAVHLMRSTMSIGDYFAKLTVKRTTTARRRPRATKELKDFAA